MDKRSQYGADQEERDATLTLTMPVAQRIIDRVSAGLRLPVSVTDNTATVLASTEPRLVGAALPVATALLTGATLDTGDAGKLLAYADHTVGTIVLHDAEPESPVLQVARTLAELIIHQLVVLDQLPHRRWARDKFLDDLLHGRLAGSADAILHQAAILEVDLAPPRLVALIDLTGLQHPSAPPWASSLRAIDRRRRVEAAKTRLVERARALAADQPEDLSFCLGDHWLAILPVVRQELPNSIRILVGRLESLLVELEAEWHFEMWAGVGGACAAWAELPHSFRDARFALEVGATLGGPERVFTVASLGLASLVCRNESGVKVALAEHVLAPLAAEPELLATLAVFLRADLAPSPAARELNIHRHTLSYRLDKIAALTKLDPRRFRDAAQLYGVMLLQRTNTRNVAATDARRTVG